MQQTFYYCFALLIALSVCQDEGCKWTYKCCKFKEENGKKICEEMCEAVINCESTTEINLSNEVESFNTTGVKSANFLFPFRRRMPSCRSGYKYTNGQCRRVLKIVHDEDIKDEK